MTVEIDALPQPPIPDLKINDAEQERLKKAMPLSAEISRAMAVIAETEAIPTADLTTFQLQDYAEALCSVGRFEDAAKLETPQSDFYSQIDRAIWAADEERCECPNQVIMGMAADAEGVISKQKITTRPWFTLRRVFSQKHGRMVSLKKCSACDYLNAID